jgi:hypothetical protein
VAELLAPRCGCADCESAVSPGAYLASLLDYALEHVQNRDQPLGVEQLADRFCQPFGSLPVDCAAAETSVPLARIAVEVLRGYVGPRPLLGTGRESGLADGEAAYRVAAYTALLTAAGSSYLEIRRARTAGAAERLALAERLGLALTPGGPGTVRDDELDRMYADVHGTGPGALTEEFLQRVFGFSPTTGDPLVAGVKTGDAAEQLARWRFDGADPGRNVDADGTVHLSIAREPGRWTVSAYADPARTELVAAGTRTTPTGPVRLTGRDSSGLTGAVELRYTADAADLSVAVVPLLLCWRLARLRAGWPAEDWPAPAAQPTPFDKPAPLLDPQTVGIGDLRRARPGIPAYDLWLARYIDLADRRSALVAAGSAAVDQATGLADMVALALTRPGDVVDVAQLEALDAAQRLGERIGARLPPLGLTPASFGFLMPILRLAQAGQPVLPPEWNAVTDTLLAAGKRRDAALWRAAEQAVGITVSPDHFRLPGRTPPAGVTGAPADLSAPEQAGSLTIASWLSTRDARRAWAEVLQARVDQEAAVGAGVAAARNAAEETALPVLRDVLVAASDAEGDSLPERAEWLTRRLLLDLRMSGASRTTRVAQAISTLQELLFRLDTGQLPVDDPGSFGPRSSVRAAATPDGRTHLVALDGDGTLWHRVWDGRWRSWHALGRVPGAESPLPPSGIALTACGNGLAVAVIGDDRVLWVRSHRTRWSPWERVPGGPPLTGVPALTDRGPDGLDAFVLRMGDLEVLRRHWDGAAWSEPEGVGAVSQRIPGATSRTPATVDLVLGKPAPSLFQPLHRRGEGGAWVDEHPPGTLGSDPALLAAGPDRLEVFVNTGGHLRRMVREAGGWQPWEDVDAGLPATDPQVIDAPSACTPAPGTVDVYAVRGSRDIGLWSRRCAAGTWSPWELLPAERLELDAVQFAAEWPWVGSYAAWRSAVFVRLYPDNLLLPSLAARQTPAFARLVDQTRPTRRITADQAQQLAGDYSRYLTDVSALQVQASCQAAVTVPGPSGVPIQRGLHFLFGRAPSGAVYWCSFDPAAVDAGGHAQSFWTQVPLAAKESNAPAPRVAEVIGALPWVSPNAAQHHIHLVLRTAEPTGPVIRRARFDLYRYGRDDFAEAGAVEISGLPTGPGGAAEPVERMTIVPVQSDSVVEAPRLAVRVSTGETYVRELNRGTDGFAPVAGDWAACQVPSWVLVPGALSYTDERVSELHAAVRTGGTNWLVYTRGSSMRVRPLVTGRAGSHMAEPPDRFLGALPVGPSSVIVFTEEDGATVYRSHAKSGGVGNTHLAPGVTGLARQSGSLRPSVIVTPGGPAAAGHAYAYLCRLEGDRLAGERKYEVVPVLWPVTSVPVGLTVFDMQARRAAVRRAYEENAAASETLLCYLREAYRLVPQQLALSLQAAGEYVAALDWFATVYDYRAPEPQRYIDHGLALDAALSPTSVLRLPEGWLLDPLNPHAVARTRRGATARYAVAAVIACLNAFADAEFGVDSSESLVRARLLYDSALGLCAAPEFGRPSADCSALLGALEIRPGEPVPPDVAAALGAIAEDLTQAAVYSSPGAAFGAQAYAELVHGAKLGQLEWGTVIPQLLEYRDTMLSTVEPPATAGSVVTRSAAVRAAGHTALLADPAVEKAVRLAGALGAVNAVVIAGGTQ